MAEKTVYSKSADGDVRNRDNDYDTCHDAATGDAVDDTDDEIIPNNNYSGTAPNYRVRRGFLYFDIGLSAGDVITAATLSIYGTAAYQGEDDAGHSDLCLFEGTQGDPLALGDFDSFDTILLTAGSYSWAYPLATNAYTAAVLNAAGIALVHANREGTVKFCIRVLGDFSDLTPTGTNTHGFFSNEEGAGKLPKLTITYTPAVTPKSQGRVMG